jgi:hypothetical protein
VRFLQAVDPQVQRHLALYHGVIPLLLPMYTLLPLHF